MTRSAPPSLISLRCEIRSIVRVNEAQPKTLFLSATVYIDTAVCVYSLTVLWVAKQSWMDWIQNNKDTNTSGQSRVIPHFPVLWILVLIFFHLFALYSGFRENIASDVWNLNKPTRPKFTLHWWWGWKRSSGIEKMDHNGNNKYVWSLLLFVIIQDAWQLNTQQDSMQ